ncbi:hypothetical protein EBR37_03765 [bacterium]|nr:hypothetical protein [bacterium]
MNKRKLVTNKHPYNIGDQIKIPSTRKNISPELVQGVIIKITPRFAHIKMNISKLIKMIKHRNLKF